DGTSDGKGTHRSADKSLLAGFIRCPVRSATCDARCLEISFMNQCAKTGIVGHALKEFLVFAPSVRFALEKKIVQTDRCSAEGVRVYDIRAGFEIIGMNFLNHVRLR